MRRLLINRTAQRLGALVVGVALVVAVVLRRDLIADAVAQLGVLSVATVATLVVLAVAERLTRAEIHRFLLPGIGMRRAVVVSDVGAAVGKGVPFGGPVATVLRWQLARERGATPVDFVTMLVASGVALAFCSWGLPLVATVVDTAGRPTDRADLAIIVVAAAVLVGSSCFWAVVLRSERAHAWVTARSAGLLRRFERVVPALGDVDPTATVEQVRDRLRAIARRPTGLLVRTAAAQITSAVVLWVALDGVGVGPELGVTEFARVFFVAQVLGSFAPTPGGVGIVEAGVTGALVAAGVDPELALAGVLLFRLVTYVLPIVLGAVEYAWWRHRRERRARDRRSDRPVGHGDPARSAA